MWALGSPLFLLRGKSQKKGVAYVMSKGSLPAPPVRRPPIRARTAQGGENPGLVVAGEGGPLLPLLRYSRTKEKMLVVWPIVTPVVLPFYMTMRYDSPSWSSISSLHIWSSSMKSRSLIRILEGHRAAGAGVHLRCELICRNLRT
jgi:hypothetical protein